eukprot:Skav227946  [mRNA]  locus=scaffold146:562065:569332:+ [translate_table: standard]
MSQSPEKRRCTVGPEPPRTEPPKSPKQSRPAGTAQAAVNLRNSKSLRLALSRATQASPALIAKASALLERLAAAESAALENLQAAERDEDREPAVPWRLLCLDFDRTIAKDRARRSYGLTKRLPQHVNPDVPPEDAAWRETPK